MAVRNRKLARFPKQVSFRVHGNSGADAATVAEFGPPLFPLPPQLIRYHFQRLEPGCYSCRIRSLYIYSPLLHS